METTRLDVSYLCSRIWHSRDAPKLGTAARFPGTARNLWRISGRTQQGCSEVGCGREYSAFGCSRQKDFGMGRGREALGLSRCE